MTSLSFLIFTPRGRAWRGTAKGEESSILSNGKRFSNETHPDYKRRIFSMGKVIKIHKSPSETSITIELQVLLGAWKWTEALEGIGKLVSR